MGVSSSYLRSRADACEACKDQVRTTCAGAEDADQELARQDQGWSFIAGLQEMQARWEALNAVIADRLGQASLNFRDSADAFDANETAIRSAFGGLPH
ncbi:hypothetical protein [Streptomyces sp. NBC_01497]|uniref:hypothetical protein n=1 Tax=Streptomyces sp. NBC_01497 TaxID=2903885 RepID=UPI002E352460|nr:hypothetical protein [Streptomyces sp. NBC_01497]